MFCAMSRSARPKSAYSGIKSVAEVTRRVGDRLSEARFFESHSHRSRKGCLTPSSQSPPASRARLVPLFLEHSGTRP